MTDAPNPFPQTWSEWTALSAARQAYWVPQSSKYNIVQYDPAPDVYYKIRQPVMAPKLAERCALYGIKPSPHHAEQRALLIANALQMTVPKKHSFVSHETELGTESCLATSPVTGWALPDFIRDPHVDKAKKFQLLHAAQCEILSTSFAFADSDRDMHNMRIHRITDHDVEFAHFDFQMAFSEGWGFQDKLLLNLAMKAQQSPHVLPKKEQMEKTFFKLGHQLASKASLIDRGDLHQMQKNLHLGFARTMQLYL